MDAIFMNSENIKASYAHYLLVNLTDEIDLRRGKKSIALSKLSICYTWQNIKSLYRNNKFEISVSMWNDKLQLSDGLYSASGIQDFFWVYFWETWKIC